jgi:signal transduction histidine kinase
MRLDKTCKQEILDIWEERVRQALPPARTQPSLALRDNLPHFLDKMFEALVRDPTTKDVFDAQNLSEVHGIERAMIEKYSLDQVLREYSILRATVLEILSREALLSTKDQLSIHALIDEGEMTAATAFEKIRIQGAINLTAEVQRHNEDLQHFASVAAHDLRGPLATIYSYVTYMEEEIKEKTPDVEQGFEFVKITSKSLLNLIDRLLIYAKSGIAVPNIEIVDVNKVIADVISSLGKSIADAHAKIIYKDLPSIASDPVLLGQLFQNLISNSLKFRSEAAPVIEIRFEKEDEEFWTFSVQDNGIGFKPDQAQIIFKPFTRLYGESKYEGSGLGLATVRRVVETLGGAIWSESEPGKGAKFIFTLAKKLPDKSRPLKH